MTSFLHNCDHQESIENYRLNHPFWGPRVIPYSHCQ